MTLEQVLIFVRLDLFSRSDFKVLGWTSFRVFTHDGLWLKIHLCAGSNTPGVSTRAFIRSVISPPMITMRETSLPVGGLCVKIPQLATAIPSCSALTLIKPNQVPFKLLNAPPTGRWVACVAVCLVENDPLRSCRQWQFASLSLILTLVYELQVFQLPVGRMNM